MTSEPSTPQTGGTDTDTRQVPFAAPTTPYRRSNCLRLRLPGVDDRTERLALADHIDLTASIDAIFEAGSGLSLLEFLTFPGADHQEYLLCGQSPRAPTKTTQQRIPEHATVGMRTVTGGVHGTIASRLASHLPDDVGIERCDLEFAPVGVSPTPTSRLAIEKNRSPTTLSNLGYNPFVHTLRALESEGWPYLFQTLLRRHDRRGGYTASVRLAAFDTKPQPSNDWDRWRIDADKPTYDLTTMYGPAGFTSNQQSYRVHTERAEYWELLRGRDGYSETYPESLGYPKMPVRPAHLPMLLGVLPLYYDWDRWGPNVPRHPPALITQELLRSAAGTNQGHGEHTALTAVTPKVMNEGGAEHQSLQAFTAQWFREQGYEVTEITQDTASRPDLRCDTGEETLAIEIESKNTSKPANLLANVARADSRGRRVVLVLGSAKAAEWAGNVVQQPSREPTDTGTLLYNWTAPVRTDDAVVLLPEGIDTAHWKLSHDGTLQLEADGRILASGPAEMGVGSFEYDTPRFTPDEEPLVVETSDGRPNATYASKGALTDDWTIVRVPHVPTQLNYLPGVRLMYHDGTTLRTFEPTADWDVSKNSRRYEGAVRAFLDTYTITADETELAIDAFREQVLAWYRHLTDREPPDRAWFGRSLPDSVDRKRRKVDGTEQSFFADRTWRYPAGLQSPDLPGVTSSGRDGGR
jgi:hypothetical protein